MNLFLESNAEPLSRAANTSYVGIMVPVNEITAGGLGELLLRQLKSSSYELRFNLERTSSLSQPLRFQASVLILLLLSGAYEFWPG